MHAAQRRQEEQDKSDAEQQPVKREDQVAPFYEHDHQLYGKSDTEQQPTHSSSGSAAASRLKNVL